MSVPDTISAFLVPICGIFVDRYGHRASLLVLCSLVIASVHATLALTMIYPVFPLIFLGVSYSIYGVAIWPSIATIIQHEEDRIRERQLANVDHLSDVGDTPDEPEEPRMLGTAYGLSTSALNTTLTIMPLIAARIEVDYDSFVSVELFFVGLALLGACASLMLVVVDKRNDGILEAPEMKEPDLDEESDGAADNDDIRNGIGSVDVGDSREGDIMRPNEREGEPDLDQADRLWRKWFGSMGRARDKGRGKARMPLYAEPDSFDS
ncbi:hypothetical protein HDV00_003540 [Rhizophlyctis rosea]|nr:hypothetical protein HDV00_003540 [Rhizophlyctis rosea]